jgi:hypothetical protein
MPAALALRRGDVRQTLALATDPAVVQQVLEDLQHDRLTQVEVPGELFDRNDLAWIRARAANLRN